MSGLDTGGYGRRTAAWARREGYHAPSALPAGNPAPVRGPGASSWLSFLPGGGQSLYVVPLVKILLLGI